MLWGQGSPTEQDKPSAEWWDVGWHDLQTTSELEETLSVDIVATVRMGTNARYVRARGSGEEAAKRWLGFLFVTAMPPAGITEAIDELAAIHTFHTEQEELESDKQRRALPPVAVRLRPQEKSAPISFDE